MRWIGVHILSFVLPKFGLLSSYYLKAQRNLISDASFWGVTSTSPLAGQLGRQWQGWHGDDGHWRSEEMGDLEWEETSDRRMSGASHGLSAYEGRPEMRPHKFQGAEQVRFKSPGEKNSW